VINKATSRAPSERYATAREMIDALDRVPLIDWKHVDELTWEGQVPATGIRYRVCATKMKRPERWRLCAQKFVTEWRRCLDDQDVADLDGKEARAFFDQLVTLATSV
jgi:hypothetical protein